MIVQPRSLVVDQKLIFVLGVQRSGTTALLESLGQDPSLRVEDESPGNQLYDRYALRPEPEIRDLLWRMPKRVLLKPLANLFDAAVEDLLEQFADYGPTAVFLYRDPLFVWQSTMRTFQVDDSGLSEWLDRWRRIHRGLLRGLSGPFRRRIALVRYEDLMRSRNVFRALCRFLHVRPSNAVFWRAKSNARPHTLSKEAVERIQSETGAILSELHAGRTFAPSAAVAFPWDAGEADSTGSVHEVEVELLGRSPEPWRRHFGDAMKLDPRLLYKASFSARSPDGLEATIGLGRGPCAMDQVHARESHRLDSNWRLYATEIREPVDDPDARFFVRLAVRPGLVEVSPPRISGVDPTVSPAPHPHEDPTEADLDSPLRVHMRSGPPSESEGSPGAGEPRLFRRTIRLADDDIGPDAAFVVVIGGGRILLYFQSSRDTSPAAVRTLPWTPSSRQSLRLVERLSDPDWIRCERLAAAEEDVGFQVWRDGFAISDGRRYSIRFRLKADDGRRVGVSQAEDPWTDLGFYRNFDLGPEWSDFYYEFVALSDCENARVLVDLSGSRVPVEIDDVAVQEEVDRYDDEFFRRAAEIIEKLRGD